MVTSLDAAFARVWTLNAEQDALELQASAGVCTHLEVPHARVLVGTSVIGQIAKDQVAHLTNDVGNDPRVDNHGWPENENMVAFAGYPLIVENRLIGVVAIFARHCLTPSVLEALASAANQIATGIERKRTEQNLRFTQFTIDHVATPVFWADADGKFFNVNDAACRLTGYSRKELLCLYVSDVDSGIPRQTWPAVWSGLRQRGTLAMESKLLCKDGTEIPISISGNLLNIDGKECSCTFLQDISERKQAADTQQESDLRCRAVSNQLQLQITRMPLAYVLFDADFCITDWNPAAEKTFGYREGRNAGNGAAL